MNKFTKLLHNRTLLVADGATGTMLFQEGLPRGTAPERWNNEHPEVVQALHASYIAAGSDLITTNTFGGTRTRLAHNSLAAHTRKINLHAAQIARRAAGSETVVLGDIGPTGEQLQPKGPLSYSDALEVFAEQAAALAEGGVDALLIETMSALNEAQAAVEGAKQSTQLPILVTMSFDTQGCTLRGVAPAQAACALWALGVDVIGANCGSTLDETLHALVEMRAAAPDAILMAKPNLGLPRLQNGALVYDIMPETLASYAQKFVREAGVKIFGACCGSTPAHIRAVKTMLENTLSLG